MGYNDVAGRSPRSVSARSRRFARVLPLPVLVAAILAAGLQGPVAVADEPVASASKRSVVVRMGDRGRAVRAVQRRLGIPADGVFGPQTLRAVRRFQRRKGLVADGIVGPITRRALRLRPFGRNSVIRPRRASGGAPADGGGGLPGLPRVLRRIAECESGGNPRAVSPDGRYRGKYQFTRSTWKSYGGRGSDPARASERHQDRVALRLYRDQGTAPWPSCGSR